MLANSNKNIKGAILIELMMATGLSLLLLSFLLGIYLTSQHSYRLQAALNHIQDNAKTAIDILNSDIKKSGYIGCARLTVDFPMVSSVDYSLTPQNKLVGTHSEIIVRHAAFPSAELQETMHDAQTLDVSKETRFSAGDILLVSDCAHAEIFQAEAVSSSRASQKIIASHPLHHQFNQYAEVSCVEINKYFIAKTRRSNQDGSPVYSLFIEDISHHKTELVEGINRMQIHYYFVQKGKLTEISASQIDDGSKVAGIAINMELVSHPIKKTWYTFVSLRGSLS